MGLMLTSWVKPGPDAVVLDLGLPNMDGVTVLQKWRKANRIMPVLILTARDRWSEKSGGF